MYLRRREISLTVAQESVPDNAAEVPFRGVCQILHTPYRISICLDGKAARQPGLRFVTGVRVSRCLSAAAGKRKKVVYLPGVRQVPPSPFLPNSPHQTSP